MSGDPRFRMDELGPTEGSELEDAMEAIRALDAAAEDVPVRTGAAFSDRVMASLVDEPTPVAAGFLAPLRRNGLVAGFGASLRQAWTALGTGRPAAMRAAALAYVLAVAVAGVSIVGAAGAGAAGALGLLGPQQTVSPSPAPSVGPLESPGPSIVAPTPSLPAPSESPEATETDDHGGGAEPSDDHGGGGAEPSDDHGGDSGSGSGSGSGSDSGGSDGSGGGSDDGSSGSGPSATDDHSGSDGGSGGTDGGSGGSGESGSN